MGRFVAAAEAATGKYKETKFHWIGKGVRVAHSTACIPRTT